MKGINVCQNCFDLSSLIGGEHMGNQKVLFIVLAVLGVGVIGFFTLSNNKQAVTQIQPTVTEEKAAVKSVVTENANSNNEFSKRFIAYSDENLQKASANGRAVVFFHAGWCPMCKQAEDDIKANFDNVPSDVTILKTDYDTSSALKRTYGITGQDTFVQVDKDGKEIIKWNSGGEGVKALLANLK